MDDIEIRPGEEADAENILAMLQSLAEETGDGDRFRCHVGDIRDFGFGDRPYFECQVAARGESYLGLALYFPLFSTTRGRPGVYLQDLWVAPECRDVVRAWASGAGKQEQDQAIVMVQDQGNDTYCQGIYTLDGSLVSDLEGNYQAP